MPLDMWRPPHACDCVHREGETSPKPRTFADSLHLCALLAVTVMDSGQCDTVCVHCPLSTVHCPLSLSRSERRLQQRTLLVTVCCPNALFGTSTAGQQSIKKIFRIHQRVMLTIKGH